MDEPRFRAMFETAAGVLEGLRKAFRDCEETDEAAFRE